MDNKFNFYCMVLLTFITLITLWNHSILLLRQTGNKFDNFVYNQLKDGNSMLRNLHPCLLRQNLCIDYINRTYDNKMQRISFKKQVNISLHHFKSNQTFKVPNIVHFISFGEGQPFEFYNYISYKSVDKYIKPLGIFLWADNQPNNQWWNRTLAEVPNIYYIHTLPVRQIGGKNVSFIANAADYLRLKILQEFGGLYFDNDVIILKSFDDMRIYPFALGRATEFSVSNGIMVGEPWGRFISIWLEAYENFHPQNFARNSVKMAHKLASIFPHLVHIEEKSFNHPTWQNMPELYRGHYNLSDNYSIHLYLKLTRYIPHNEPELAGYDCTVGDAMRIVLYDSPDLRSNKTVEGKKLKEKRWVIEQF